MTRRYNACDRGSRIGAATVEMAMMLPLLIIIVFGAIEITTRLFLRQSATVAAYEGARLAARRTVDSATVRSRCLDLLEGRNITGATVAITPENTADVPTGGQIQIQITVPYTGNTPTAFALDGGNNLQVTATMLRE